jgi:hypothetical protein
MSLNGSAKFVGSPGPPLFVRRIYAVVGLSDAKVFDINPGPSPGSAPDRHRLLGGVDIGTATLMDEETAKAQAGKFAASIVGNEIGPVRWGRRKPHSK